MVVQKEDPRRMAAILVDATVNDSGISSLGSLEDAERVVMQMLDLATTEPGQSIQAT
jgi:hypothetical protein